MSRTVVAQDAETDSFAGLLNRLTRHIAPESPGAATSSRKRPMIAVTEVKPRRNRLGADTVELSYERALRLHSRRADTATDFSPPVAAPPPASLGSNPAALRASPQKVEPSSTHAQVRKHRKDDASGRLTGKTQSKPASARVHHPANAAPPAEAEKKARAANPAASAEYRTQATLPQKAAKSVARSAVKLPVKAKAPSNPATGPNSPTKRARMAQVPQQQSGPASTTGISKAKKKKNVPGTGIKTDLLRPTPPRQQLHIEPLKPLKSLAHPVELDHRRSIISMRLNEDEFSRLRNRAAESGISVSAYMRSCVLEAEHLRAQVKQALAEMRASTHQPDSTQVSALSRAVRLGHAGTAETGNRWSRLIAFSATFLLGPWFTSRRRA